MLKLGSSTHYYFPVSGSARDEDGGIYNFSFTAKFRRIPAETTEAIVAAISEYAKALEHGLGTEFLEEKYGAERKNIPFTTVDVARYVWDGWKDDGSVVDDDDNPMVYTEEKRDKYLARQGMPAAICSAWMESINTKTGKPEGAKTKNSERRGFTG